MRGKNCFSSEYSWAASVLLCDITSVFLPHLAITFATVNVLPEPVTPRRVCLLLSCTPDASSDTARGWSPVGSNGEASSNSGA